MTRTIIHFLRKMFYRHTRMGANLHQIRIELRINEAFRRYAGKHINRHVRRKIQRVLNNPRSPFFLPLPEDTP